MNAREYAKCNNYGYTYEEPWEHRYLNRRPIDRLVLHSVPAHLPSPAEMPWFLLGWLMICNAWLTKFEKVNAILLRTTYLESFDSAPHNISELNSTMAWIGQFFLRRGLVIFALPGEEYHPLLWRSSDACSQMATTVLPNMFHGMLGLEPLKTLISVQPARVLRPRAQYTGETVDAILLNLLPPGDPTMLAKDHAISFLYAIKGDVGAASRPPLGFVGWFL